jgi:hypothetical protein
MQLLRDTLRWRNTVLRRRILCTQPLIGLHWSVARRRRKTFYWEPLVGANFGSILMKKFILLGALLIAAPVIAQDATPDIAPYLQGGISGFGGGVSFGTGTAFRIRADLYHGISRTVNQTESGVRYQGKLKYSESGLFVDWFPSSSRFRLSGGAFFNRSQIDLSGSAANGTSADINGRTYALSGADSVSASVRWPSVMPYLGVGWGMGPSDKGWNFTADLGVALGRPKTTLDVSPSIRAKITGAGLNADNELDAERLQFQDSANKYFVYPVARAGISYKF